MPQPNHAEFCQHSSTSACCLEGQAFHSWSWCWDPNYSNGKELVVMFIGNLVGPSVSPILETGAVDKLHDKSLGNCSYIMRTQTKKKRQIQLIWQYEHNSCLVTVTLRMLIIHKNPGPGIRNQPPWSHQFPETTGAALLKCSLGRCWAWRSNYPNTFPQWAPMRCSFPPKKKYIKHLTRLTKSQLHSTFDPGRPDIGWWPWPKHQRQASHFPNPWRFIIWWKKKRWRCLLPKAVAMVDPVFPVGSCSP